MNESGKTVKSQWSFGVEKSQWSFGVEMMACSGKSEESVEWMLSSKKTYIGSYESLAVAMGSSMDDRPCIGTSSGQKIKD